jgi:hypothetical protein
MGSIVKLLFGREAETVARLFTPDDRAGAEMADRSRRAGEWCASTPGSGAARTRQIRPRLTNRDLPGR